MSTFDGLVKEFPNIRIDYFRQHPARPPPAACFLSHVHSDHLQGLDTLKMPFIYCSSTTRKLLLRMEKYPHRMNFAKGILESRKQTYKHLRFILRALPLQTVTEIELNPKTKIRATLFDANHCPGAVSILIEGDSRAILYTGDVRAEPWWVNSIVQNPYILPYACGIKRLDCVYLDTTFASHSDVHKRFPTKAEGLKELLQKISQFPNDTIFYFRAWTLGYEQVWMAMSSLLSCYIHVDEYQLRLFIGTLENGRDGFSTFEGPALAGFTVGNEDHHGCLTTSSEARIHSCEPGTACHAALKQNNVVWVTPIISRLDDGTEVLEVGAGGGLGDLYQVPELEIIDLAILQALESLCGELNVDADSTKKFLDAITAGQKLGGTSISLEGLGLNAEAEISLKDFVRLMSGRGKLHGKATGGLKDDEAASGSKDRMVHFPYSRHSSYEELRHLISAFRPRDICACTVELESWSEDLSMQSLFGDLCSEKIFSHDNEVRTEVEETRKAQEATSLKRKRDEQSQVEDDETQSESEEGFVSAKGDLSSGSKAGDLRSTSEPQVENQNESISQRPLILPGPQQIRNCATSVRTRRKLNVEVIKQEFREMNGGSDFITIEDEPTDSEGYEAVERREIQTSVTSSVFESQAEGMKHTDGLQLDATRANTQAGERLKPGRGNGRRRAFDAAVRSLRDNDSSDWEALTLRSIGRNGHTRHEMEL